MSDAPPKVPSRILVAEDTEVISLLMTEVLTRAGFEVELTKDGEECLEAAQRQLPDLIILDLMMPKLHGIEVLKRLRSDPETADVSVIVCSAKAFKAERAAAVELGVLAFVPKPFRPEELLDTVHAFFDRSVPLDPLASPATAAPIGKPYRPRIDFARPKMTLWGTRGSTPTPGAAFMRHGGNTSCMMIEKGDHKLIFDAGSGIRELGIELMREGPCRIHLFITHTHWDHIQGFPFFTPAFASGYEITVYGAEGFGKSLESVFRGQLDQDYFPVQMEDMSASIEFRHLEADPLDIGGIEVSWEYAHHPGATVGYKAKVDDTSVAWFPDDEFMAGYVGSPAGIDVDDPIVAPYRRLVDFLHGTDVLIHEAQYTSEEYPDKIGWGHSSVSNAALLAKFAEVRRWIVTHHDPMHDDRFLDDKLLLTRQELKALGSTTRVDHGHDGMVELL